MDEGDVSRRAPIVRAAAIVAVVLVIWSLLAIRRPELTYHFAPLIAAIAGPASLRRNGAVPLSQAGVVGVATATLVIAVSVGLHVAGVLDGPTFWDDGPALTEALLFAVIGSSLGTRTAVRQRSGLLGALFEA